VSQECLRYALDSVSPDETFSRSYCAVTTNSVHLDTRIGCGGYPRGQPPSLMPKGSGTRAGRQSGGQREGAATGDPQDLHEVVQAALLDVQVSSVQGSPMGRAPDDHADLARDSKDVALRLPPGKRPSEIRTGEHASSAQHARTTDDHARPGAVSQARDGLKGASPTVTEPPEESAGGHAVYTGPEESKKPTGDVRQVAHGQDVKGRARRTAATLLTIIQDRGKRKRPRDDGYRPLSHPARSLRAYTK
jgi:hypothetical protein